MSIQIGSPLPDFQLKAVDALPLKDITIDNVFIDLTKQDYIGKWLILFFYPKDFTFVCPTELAAFGALKNKLDDRDTQLLGASTDSEFAHWAWRKHQKELRDLPYPLLSDVKGDLSRALGILEPKEGVAQRATFIIDPRGYVRFSMVTDFTVGRNPKEVLRILDGLQTDALCPCN
mgnify:CR=1 FL=1